MKKSFSLSRIAFCAAVFCSLGSFASAQLVVNGGFESGLSGWTVNDPSGFTLAGNDPALSNTGNGHANLGAFNGLGSLSQTLSTTPGTAYDLSFFLANDGTPPTNEFDVFWDGASIFSLTNVAPFSYTNYSFTGLIASGTTTALEFRHRNDDDFFRLDDVTVVVPEGSSAALAVIGLVLLGAISFGRRGQNQTS